MNRCPECKTAFKHRVKRTALSRLIPGSKLFKCDQCYGRYLWVPFINRFFKRYI